MWVEVPGEAGQGIRDTVALASAAQQGQCYHTGETLPV